MTDELTDYEKTIKEIALVFSGIAKEIGYGLEEILSSPLFIELQELSKEQHRRDSKKSRYLRRYNRRRKY